jgi:hypothetical protein
MRHATISAWQRQHEDGSYAAEIDGWALKVTWHPETPGAERGFTWTAERGGTERAGTERAGTEVFEEIELAMSDAEAQTAEKAPKAADAGDGAEGDGAHGHAHH